LRNDETYMDGLGGERIPDPTTAGDFLRRFHEVWIFALQKTINFFRPDQMAGIEATGVL
jgi:hypothetical protein